MAFKVGDYVMLLEDEPHGAFGVFKGDILKVIKVDDITLGYHIRATPVFPTDRKPLQSWYYRSDLLQYIGRSKTIPPLIKALYGI